MLIELLGGDQTIDLSCWASAIGIRRAFWEALPAVTWAACITILDAEGRPNESLYITCQGHSLHLRFLAPSYWHALSLTGSNLQSLAASLFSELPSTPPVLCTIVLDRQAGSEMVLSVLTAAQRSAPFRARLLTQYGQHWTIFAASPLVLALTQRILTADIGSQLRRIVHRHEGRAFVFHRAGVPTTRGGFRLIDGYPHLLTPDELSGLSGAIWVDERLIGEGLSIIERALTIPGLSNAKGVFAGLASLLQQGFLRFPDDGPVRRLRWLPRAAAAARVRNWLLPPNPATRAWPDVSPMLTLALYFRVDVGDGLDPTADQPDGWGRCRQVLEILSRHPEVRATIGWTQTAVDRLAASAPNLLQSYRAAVESGQLETAHAGSGPPLSLYNSRELVRDQVLAWQTSADDHGMPTSRLGFVPPGGKLAPGWSEVLWGGRYSYAAVSEEQIRGGYAQFDPSRPVSIEGWPTVGFCHELERVLSASLDWEILDLYFRLLASDRSRPVLAVSLELDRLRSIGWLEPFLCHARESGYSFCHLSGIADTPPQGVAETYTNPQSLSAWTGDEHSRRLNALVAQTQSLWQDVLPLCARVEAYRHQQVPEAHPAAPVPPATSASTTRVGTTALHKTQPMVDTQVPGVRQQAAFLTLRTNHYGWFASETRRKADVAEVQRALAACQTLARRQLAQLGPFSRSPSDALGVIRLYDAHTRGSQTHLVCVEIPLPDGVSPQTLVFLQHGIPISAQYVNHTHHLARYLVAVNTGTSDMVDLVVLTGHPMAFSEGLDITTERMCNPWLVILLDECGQVTSIRHQGREHLCGPSNTVRGYLLHSDTPLQPELAKARITVTMQGPLAGAVTVHQTLAPDVELIRLIRITKFSPLLECVTRLTFARPARVAQELIVGEFQMVGQEATWTWPLQAGMCSLATTDIPSVVLAPDDVIDVHTANNGLRYLVHQPTTRTCLYSVRSVPGGLRVGLIASMPSRALDWTQIAMRPGLGFPGQTYAGSYAYRHALLPLTTDVELSTAAYNHSVLWAFFPSRTHASQE